MHSIFNLFAVSYSYFSTRKWMLAVLMAILVIFSGLALTRLSIHENIYNMLPDGKDRNEAADFDLLQKTPLFKTVVIHLTAAADTGPDDLIGVTGKLANALNGKPYFSHVTTGPENREGASFFPWLVSVLPGLLSEKDLTMIDQKITISAIKDALTGVRDQLRQPEGMFIKSLVQIDPLDFRSLILTKFRYLNLFPGMRIKQNHFISRDGRHSLIIAKTPVEITNFRTARTMLSDFHALRDKWVPKGIDAQWISGHRYTEANAGTIKKDMRRVLTASAAGLVLIYIVFFRHWRRIYVFVVPVAAVMVATSGMGWVFGQVSAVTIGFGAVLLGITVDFALHLSYALSLRQIPAAEAVSRVAKPMLFSGLTTLSAFGVLLFSHLPAQRELAVFAIMGIIAGIFLSLIVLPHVISFPEKKECTASHLGLVRILNPDDGVRRWVIFGWALLLVAGFSQVHKIQINGDLKQVNFVPVSLRNAETELAAHWGNFRGRAVVFSEGKDLEAALTANAVLFDYLIENDAESTFTSIAPLLPPVHVQSARQARWHAFWSEDKKAMVRKYFEKAGAELGFHPTAFSPFFTHLEGVSDPVNREDPAISMFKALIDAFIVSSDGRIRIMTLVPDDPIFIKRIRQFQSSNASVKLVSQNEFGRTISRVVREDFNRFVITALVVVIFLLIVLFKNIKKVVLSLIPIITGVAFMLGVMGFGGRQFNLFNMIAVILVLGLGVDYGIFMVMNKSGKKNENAGKNTAYATQLAVLVSGLTTLAGFGALILARHPAMASIGLTVFSGITAAVFAALWVVPALQGRIDSESNP